MKFKYDKLVLKSEVFPENDIYRMFLSLENSP